MATIPYLRRHGAAVKMGTNPPMVEVGLRPHDCTPLREPWRILSM